MNEWVRAVLDAKQGTAQVEELVLLATVAIAFAAAALPLGSLLLTYHQIIEYVLLLPVP